MLERESRHPSRLLSPVLLTVVLSFTAYWLTLAPDLTWANFGADGGDLITAAVTMGIPHPPGYPVYVLFGKLASFIPAGTVAFRFNLLSALSTSAAAGFVTATAHAQIRRQSRSNTARIDLCALAIGLSFALAPLVWAQAIVAEVYSLNLAFLAAFLWALLGKRSIWLTGTLLGLSVSTHLTSLMMLPLALLLTARRAWPALVAAFLVGLSPFLLLPLFAQTGSAVVWGDPTTPAGWWWLVSGQVYRGNVLALPVTELPARLGSWTQTFLRQYTLAGPLLLALGLIRLDKALRRQTALLLGVGGLFLLYGLLYESQDAIVYTLPCCLVFAIVLASGVHHVGLVSLLIPLVSLASNFAQIDSSTEVLVRPAAEELLTRAPANSLLITPGDATIFALWYYHHVEHERSDLILVDSKLFSFDWYRRRLELTYPQLNGTSDGDVGQLKIANQDARPVCTVQLLPGTDEITPSIFCNPKDV